MAVAAGCTQKVGTVPNEVAPVTTTTSRSGTATSQPATATTLAGRTSDQITASLKAATGSRNFCALTSALDDAIPDATDGQSIISTYQAIDQAVRAAQSFRPDELADSWTVVVDGVDEGLAAAKRVGGDLADPALRAPFTASDFESAMTLVESWADGHCTTG